MDDPLTVPSLNGQVKSGSDPAGGPSGDDKTKHNFVLHWLNNKEMEFTVQAEKIMEDLLKMALEKDDVSAEAFEYELTHPDKVLKQIIRTRSSWPQVGGFWQISGFPRDRIKSETIFPIGIAHWLKFFKNIPLVPQRNLYLKKPTLGYQR